MRTEYMICRGDYPTIVIESKKVLNQLLFGDKKKIMDLSNFLGDSAALLYESNDYVFINEEGYDGIVISVKDCSESLLKAFELAKKEGSLRYHLK